MRDPHVNHAEVALVACGDDNEGGAMTSIPRVAVLGTGRMGAAMATRLSSLFDVVTWSRSGSAVTGIDAAPNSSAAVKDADVVLLALFDAAACRSVLDECLADVATTAVVVNTATVGPDEARELDDLVRRTGRTFVHAPVMGSVPSVLAGELTVVTGGEATGVARVVLEELGDLVETPDPTTAAGLKLVAIGALGDCLLDVRTALGRGRALGLDDEALLGVLARSPLGGLVRSKHDRLRTPAAAGKDAEFTVGALAKDLALLGSATAQPHRATAMLDALHGQGALTASDDIAALCVADLASGAQELADARLVVAGHLTASDDVLEPLHAYAHGHATGDAQHFRRAFRPSAHIEGLHDGAFRSWDLDTYCTMFDGPAPDEADRRRIVDDLQVAGTVATARMTLLHGSVRFTDLFLLVREEGRWQIANKVYDREEL
jgi:3-hydroxyisobutyrate dehydrogenase